MVAIKQCEKARLRARGAFNAAETQIVPRPLYVPRVVPWKRQNTDEQ